MPIPVSIDRFLGLTNTKDTLRTVTEGGIGLTQADNVYVDDEYKLVFAEGFTALVAGTPSELYTTMDEERCYFIDGTTLYTLTPDYQPVQIGTVTADSSYDWCEVNERVYLISKKNALTIDPDHSVRVWGIPIPPSVTLTELSGYLPAGRYMVTCTYTADDGRVSGAAPAEVIDLSDDSAIAISDIPQAAGFTTTVWISSTNGDTLYRAFATDSGTVVWNGPVDDLVVPLRYMHLQPPPSADRITYYRGRLYLSKWDAHRNLSMLYMSQPLGFEHFDLYRDVLPLPGRIYVLKGTPDALVIGTDSEIYLYVDGTLRKVADYGVPSGKSDAVHEDKVYFWSNRGVCVAPPFENLTEDTVSLPPGTDTYGAIIESGGVKKYAVMLTDAGTARDSYT